MKKIIVLILVTILFSCKNNYDVIKIYITDSKNCNQSKNLSLSKSIDSTDCFKYLKSSRLKKDIFSKDNFKKGIGYSFDTKYSFLIKKSNDTVSIIDYDGHEQIIINRKNKEGVKKLLSKKGEQVYSDLLNSRPLCEVCNFVADK